MTNEAGAPEAVATTRRQAVCRCEVWSAAEDGREEPVAVAQGTIVAAGAPALAQD
jgi:acyl-coenzyme A thioesterase PaaI-like protein